MSTDSNQNDSSVNETQVTGNEVAQSTSNKAGQKKGLPTFVVVIITVLLTLAISYGLMTAYLFPSEFNPVQLSDKEQQQLDNKLHYLTGSKPPRSADEPLQPEAYSETEASREIHFTEKELNALLANNTDLANKLAIDLSDNLASAKLLVDLDPELPVLGGKTLKITAGLELRIDQHHPRAILKGVSVWGVPLPDDWLGNLKNIDLLKEFGDAGGFWQSIEQGIEEIEITQGKLRVKLKE